MSKELSKKDKLTQFTRKIFQTDMFAVIAKYRRKTGKPLKAGSKAETKIIRAFCFHHYKSDKGKIRPTTSYRDSIAHCYMCNENWNAAPQSPENVHAALAQTKDLINSAKFMSVAINADPSVTMYLSRLSVEMVNLPKVVNRINEVVIKGRHKKKGKKKNNGYDSNFRTPGTWSVNR